MKLKNNKWMRFVFALLIMGNLISCEEAADTYQENPNILNEDIGLQYENVVTFSYQEKLTSAQPTFNIEKSRYQFTILDVNVDGKPLTTGLSIFTIDPTSGIIEIDNTSGGLEPGQVYNFDIGIENVNGVIRSVDAFVLSVFDIPLDYTISNDTYDAKFLEVGEVATVLYADTSTSGDVLTDISYSLNNAPIGFTIDSETGVISKNTQAAFGENLISVTIDSNLGAKTFKNVLNVTVGVAPELNYVQQDGNTTLTNVVLSPWTVYTTANPIMEGMNAVSYEIIYPETITAGGLVVDENGSITVLSDQNLPIGVHSIGVIATNIAGISATFENRFTLTVDTRWEETDLFNDTFDDDTTGPVDPGNLLYPEFGGYTLGTTNIWNKAVIEKSGKPTIRGIRVQNPGTNHHYLVRTVDITGVKAMKVSFGEQSGYNDKFVSETYSRGLYAGESTTDLEGGSFNPASWTDVMAPSDPRWPGTATWSSRVPNEINDIDVDLSNITGTTLKLAWYIGGDTAQNGQYIIDSCNAQVSVAFPAEEQ